MYVLQVFYTFVHKTWDFSLSEVSFYFFPASQHPERILVLPELLLLHFFYITKIDLQTMMYNMVRVYLEYVLIFITFRANWDKIAEKTNK